MRALLLSAALVLAAGSASAQNPLADAKRVAQKSVDAANKHTDAMQSPEGKAARTTPAPQQAGKAAGKAQASGKGQPAAGAKLDVAAADTAGPPPSILREVFDYQRDGRRDPFVSLLTTTELRPTMSDLRLTSILLDLGGGRNSVAILRDVATNAQYRVHVGSTLGRMRVSSIHGVSVVFTIDEFGTTRQDSLILRDTTKVRRP